MGLARARASRSACMLRALLPVRRCSFSQAAQHPCRRGQRELLLLLLLVWLELLLPPLLVGNEWGPRQTGECGRTVPGVLV